MGVGRALNPAAHGAPAAKRRGRAGQKWHADETYVKVGGRWCYLYRAGDADGNLVDSLLTGLTQPSAEGHCGAMPKPEPRWDLHGPRSGARGFHLGMGIGEGADGARTGRDRRRVPAGRWRTTCSRRSP
jgi:hypothetical protein